MISFDHQPGEPYSLTREHFLHFLGQSETYQQMLAVFTSPGKQRAEQRAFWATLAAFEAFREFNPLDGCCGSDLAMDTHGDEPGCMRWRYWSTSGTLFEASEPREFLTKSAPGYPGTECSMELKPGFFRVTIPAERDQPGRYHWEQLRQGGAYCD